MIQFSSIEAFVPSGKDFDGSRAFFQELGFTLSWDAGDYIGFEKDGCKFILQNYDHAEFAQNLMLSVQVNNASDFYQMVMYKKLPEKFAIKVSPPSKQPYGIEVNIIDLAGVCWHFVQG